MSVCGIGIDIVSVPRFVEFVERKGDKALQRLFAPGEDTVGLSGPRLAARFAGKEAVMKALGAGMGTVAWHDIQIVSTPSGRPQVLLEGRARELARIQGIARVELSLSHEQDTAVAVAISVGGPGGVDQC
ncbi:MAG: holo-ACP synthase [Bacillota bacterium]